MYLFMGLICPQACTDEVGDNIMCSYGTQMYPSPGCNSQQTHVLGTS